MKIVWIASYPRSGNTWVRLLLHHYLYGAIDDTDLIDARIPDLHLSISKQQELSTNNDEALLVKSHFCCSSEHPYIDQTSAFIYILRNPRDVLMSNARVLSTDLPTKKLRKFADAFIDELGVPHWRQSGMGTWPQHISSWLNPTVHVPHLFIKYEDLRADTEGCLEKMVRFLGKSPDAQKLRESVAGCSLDKVREQEQTETKSGRTDFFSPTNTGVSFVGNGRMAQSLDFIDPDIERRFQQRFGGISRLFGYE